MFALIIHTLTLHVAHLLIDHTLLHIINPVVTGWESPPTGSGEVVTLIKTARWEDYRRTGC